MFSHYQHEDYNLMAVQQLVPKDGCHLTSYKLSNVLPSKLKKETVKVTYLAYSSC